MISTIGGLLMLLGSFFTLRGQINISIMIYFIADIAWILLSIQANNIFGAFVIFVAMVVGIVVLYKMKKGTFNKTIRKEVKS